MWSDIERNKCGSDADTVKHKIDNCSGCVQNRWGEENSPGKKKSYLWLSGGVLSQFFQAGEAKHMETRKYFRAALFKGLQTHTTYVSVRHHADQSGQKCQTPIKHALSAQWSGGNFLTSVLNVKSVLITGSRARDHFEIRTRTRLHLWHRLYSIFSTKQEVVLKLLQQQLDWIKFGARDTDRLFIWRQAICVTLNACSHYNDEQRTHNTSETCYIGNR